MTASNPSRRPQPFIVGMPVLLMIDFQRDMYLPSSEGGIPRLDDAHERVPRARALVIAARKVRIPVVFVQEVHRPDMIDFGRELDGD